MYALQVSMKCFYALKAERMAAVSVCSGNSVTVSAFIVEFVFSVTRYSSFNVVV